MTRRRIAFDLVFLGQVVVYLAVALLVITVGLQIGIGATP